MAAWFASLLAFVLVVALGLSVFLFWAKGEKYQVGPQEAQIWSPSSASSPADVDGELKLLTWNIAFAQGRGSEGDVVIAARSAEEMKQALNAIAGVIVQSGADIVFLQEVDFDSNRSHHLNQAQFLAQKTGLNYVVPVVSWKVNYLPFPYWPPSRHYGKIRSGGAILSRFPLAQGENYLLPKPAKQSAFYQSFYIGRYAQKVVLDWGGQKYLLVNHHLESWDIPNKREQVGLLLAWLKKDGRPILALGGDLNSPPPEAKKRTGFENEDDYTGDDSLALYAQGLSGLVEVQAKAVDRPETFTFPSFAPNRKLDHFFVPAGLNVTAKVLAAGPWSDHLPLFVSIKKGDIL